MPDNQSDVLDTKAEPTIRELIHLEVAKALRDHNIIPTPTDEEDDE